jgi:hypothetical protein
VEEKKPRPYS